MSICLEAHEEFFIRQYTINVTARTAERDLVRVGGQNIERGQNSRTVEYLMSRNIIFMEVSACTACNVVNRMLEMKVGSIILTNNTKPRGHYYRR